MAEGIWHNFGKPDGREMKAVTPKYLKARKTGQKFPGSMGPKISAPFLLSKGRPIQAWAIIGDLNDAAELMSGAKGQRAATCPTTSRGHRRRRIVAVLVGWPLAPWPGFRIRAPSLPRPPPARGAAVRRRRRRCGSCRHACWARRSSARFCGGACEGPASPHSAAMIAAAAARLPTPPVPPSV